MEVCVLCVVFGWYDEWWLNVLIIVIGEKKIKMDIGILLDYFLF